MPYTRWWISPTLVLNPSSDALRPGWQHRTRKTPICPTWLIFLLLFVTLDWIVYSTVQEFWADSECRLFLNYFLFCWCKVIFLVIFQSASWLVPVIMERPALVVLFWYQSSMTWSTNLSLFSLIDLLTMVLASFHLNLIVSKTRQQVAEGGHRPPYICPRNRTSCLAPSKSKQ